MAKLPDKESLGGLPRTSVPGGLPSANMSAVGEGYRDLGRGLQSLSAAIEAHYKEQEDIASVGQKADFSIGLDKDLTDAKLNPDYEKAPEKFKESAYKRLDVAKQGMSAKEAVKFDSAARVRIEGYYHDLHASRDGMRKKAAYAEDDVRLDEFAALGATALNDPDNPNWNYYDEKKREGLAVIDARAKQFKTSPKDHQKRRRDFIEGMDALSIKTVADRDPAQALDILRTFKLDPNAGEPEDSFQPSGDYTGKRSQIAPGYTVPRGEVEDYIAHVSRELGINPRVAQRVADSEGMSQWQSTVVKNGKRERSYGPFQLYIDGGLGNRFQKDTGLDPSDPANWKEGVRYALETAKKEGWGAWYGAKHVGVTGRMGLDERVAQADTGTATDATTEVSAKSKSPGIMVNEFGQTMRPDTFLKLQKSIEQQAKNRAADERRERLLAREEAKAASDQAEMKYYDRITRKDPTVKLEDVFADRPDNALDAAARLRVKRFYEHDSKPEPDARISAQTEKNLWADIDSGKITDAGPILEAYAPARDPLSGTLTRSGRDDLLKHLGAKLANKDDPLERQIKDMTEVYKNSFRKTPGIPDPQGDVQWFKWQQALRKKIKEYRNPPDGADGKPGPKKDPAVLLDPESKEYFGSPAILQDYRRTFREITRDVRESMRPKPLGQPAPADEQRRKPDESADDYLKRRGL